MRKPYSLCRTIPSATFVKLQPACQITRGPGGRIGDSLSRDTVTSAVAPIQHASDSFHILAESANSIISNDVWSSALERRVSVNDQT